MKKIQPNPEFIGLHIGQIIKKCVEDKGLSHRFIAQKMDFSTTGAYHKYSNPVYGTIYDIIKVSQIIDKDIFGLIYNELHVRFPDLFDYKEFHNAKSYANEKDNDLIAALKKENDSLYALVKVLKASQKS